MKRIAQLGICLVGWSLLGGELLDAAAHSRSTSSSSDGNAVSLKLLGPLEEHLLASEDAFQPSCSSSSSSSSSASSCVVVSKATSVVPEECRFCSFGLEGITGVEKQVFCLSQHHLTVFNELFGLPSIESGTGRAADDPSSYKFDKKHDLEYVVALVAANYLDSSRQVYGTFRDDSAEVSAKISKEVAEKIAHILAASGVQTLKGEVQQVSLYILFCWIGREPLYVGEEQRRFLSRIWGCVEHDCLEFFRQQMLASARSKESVSEDVLIEKAVAEVKRDLAGYFTTFTKRNKRDKELRKDFSNELLGGICEYMDGQVAHEVLGGKESKVAECIRNLISPRSRSGSDADRTAWGTKSVSDSGGNSADRSLNSMASVGSGSPKTPPYGHNGGRSPRVGDGIKVEGDPVFSGISPVVSPRHQGKRASVASGVNNSDSINDVDDDGNEVEDDEGRSLAQFQYQPVAADPAEQRVGCCKRCYLRCPRVVIGAVTTLIAAAGVGSWFLYKQFA